MTYSMEYTGQTHALYRPWRSHHIQWWKGDAPVVQNYLKTQPNGHNFNYIFLDGNTHFEQVSWEDWMLLRTYSAAYYLNTTNVHRLLTVRTEWSRK